MTRNLLPAATLALAATLGLGACADTVNPYIKARTGVDAPVAIARMCKAGGNVVDEVTRAYRAGELDDDPLKNREKAEDAYAAAIHAKGICADPEHGDQAVLNDLTAQMLTLRLFTRS